MQDCLSGDGKTLMCVNVSPTPASSHETLCSLKFASQVSQVQQGPAKKAVFSIPKNLNPVLTSMIVPSAPPTNTSMSAPQRELIREVSHEVLTCQRVVDSEHSSHHEHHSKYSRRSIASGHTVRTAMKRPLAYIPEHAASHSATSSHLSKKHKPLPPKPSSWR